MVMMAEKKGGKSNIPKYRRRIRCNAPGEPKQSSKGTVKKLLRGAKTDGMEEEEEEKESNSRATLLFNNSRS